MDKGAFRNVMRVYKTRFAKWLPTVAQDVTKSACASHACFLWLSLLPPRRSPPEPPLCTAVTVTCDSIRDSAVTPDSDEIDEFIENVQEAMQLCVKAVPEALKADLDAYLADDEHHTAGVWELLSRGNSYISREDFREKWLSVGQPELKLLSALRERMQATVTETVGDHFGQAAGCRVS